MIVLQILTIIGIPFLLLKLEKKWSWFKAIVMSYVLGILIGNIIPSAFDMGIAKEITGISIILAIPLMLFSTSIGSILKQPKTLLISYGLAVVATTISVLVGYYLFRDSLENIEVISGMVEGVYTGGTVNLNAIGIAYQVPNELVVLMNSFDWSFSGIYLLLIFTVLPKLLEFVLPKTKVLGDYNEEANEDAFETMEMKGKVVSISKGVGLSVFLLVTMAGVSFLWFGNLNELVLIFGVTGLALLLSSVKGVQSLKGNMIASDFFMLIFGFSLGLQANIFDLFTDRSELFSYFLLTYSLMLLIHLALAKIFKVDVHSFLISSSAAVFGPPFIGPIAEALGNRALITSGIIVALIGNAIGTYLGVVLISLLLA